MKIKAFKGNLFLVFNIFVINTNRSFNSSTNSNKNLINNNKKLEGILIGLILGVKRLCSNLSFSTLSSINSEVRNLASYILHPYFITGFIDGEGYFTVNVRPEPKMKTG
jgi:hypothetical protein